jgi:hypothetical protein
VIRATRPDRRVLDGGVARIDVGALVEWLSVESY